MGKRSSGRQQRYCLAEGKRSSGIQQRNCLAEGKGSSGIQQRNFLAEGKRSSGRQQRNCLAKGKRSSGIQKRNCLAEGKRSSGRQLSSRDKEVQLQTTEELYGKGKQGLARRGKRPSCKQQGNWQVEKKSLWRTTKDMDSRRKEVHVM